MQQCERRHRQNTVFLYIVYIYSYYVDMPHDHSAIPSENPASPKRWPGQAIKGRGAHSNPALRYAKTQTERNLDQLDAVQKLSELKATNAKSIISRNHSPDIPFNQSINPYQGCEHGCVYCYARPTHAYHDLSPGLDFETRILFKPNAAKLLEHELAAPNYHCQPIALGANTDPYQPAEKELKITRAILEVLWQHRHPVTIVTKGSLIERDLDLLSNMAKENLVSVMVSTTTLDSALKRTLEPRASAPSTRLQIMQKLADRGIPVGALVAPVIPAINDHELEDILKKAADSGAQYASYVLLRLPLEVAPLFEEWLNTHHPMRAKHVMSLIRQAHNGKNYRCEFGTRQIGSGPYAALLKRRFEAAMHRFGLDGCQPPLSTQQFIHPQPPGHQLSLL